jgi:hypothetical protein
MIKLALAGIVVLIILFALIIIIRNKPDFWFWLFLNLFFDPGGYIQGFWDGNVFGLLDTTDIFIVGIVICLIFSKTNWQVIFEDKFLVKFIFYLLIFSAYYFIVYGGVVPYFHNDFHYQTFLIKNRVFTYGFIILISVYVFSLRGLYLFYTTTLAIGIICLTLYFISLLTGARLIPVQEFARYTGEEMMRIGMFNYGLFDSLFPLSLITYLISKKINLNLKYKNWLYFSGVVMIITLLLTLTRRTQIDIIGMILLITLIISYLFRIGKLSSIFKIIIPVLLVILIMYFTFPKYIGYTAEIGEDTFLLITTGRDSRGESDQRVTASGDYELVKEYIGNNLFFGTGYTELYWMGPGNTMSSRGKKFANVVDAAGEVPIYYLLFGFGFVGAILMLPLYFMMGKLFIKMIKMLRLTLINYFHDPLTLIFSMYILLTISLKFTLNLYAFSSDFRAARLGFIMVFMGIGLALHRKLFSDLL